MSAKHEQGSPEMYLPDTPQDTDNRLHQNALDDARLLLNAEGYVVIKWRPGDTWAAGEIRDISELGLAIQLSADETRSAANQINQIWAETAHSEV